MVTWRVLRGGFWLAPRFALCPFCIAFLLATLSLICLPRGYSGHFRSGFTSAPARRPFLRHGMVFQPRDFPVYRVSSEHDGKSKTESSKQAATHTHTQRQTVRIVHSPHAAHTPLDHPTSRAYPRLVRATECRACAGFAWFFSNAKRNLESCLWLPTLQPGMVLSGLLVWPRQFTCLPGVHSLWCVVFAQVLSFSLSLSMMHALWD